MVRPLRPLVVDLFCGKGEWAHGLIAAGWNVVGFDIADAGGYPGQLVLQDVLTIDGAQLAGAGLIVASPPCQAFSYMAMPWSRAKSMADGYRCCWGRRHRLTELFRACFRIQREAGAAAGRRIPPVVENVVGAQKWVGRAACHYGSFYLWGDVPALMSIPRNGISRQERGIKQGGGWWHDPESFTRTTGSRSAARKQASARIAMIPFPLARWIGEAYYPHATEGEA